LGNIWDYGSRWILETLQNALLVINERSKIKIVIINFWDNWFFQLTKFLGFSSHCIWQ
jgi:hypothetical protein